MVLPAGPFELQARNRFRPDNIAVGKIGELQRSGAIESILQRRLVLLFTRIKQNRLCEQVRAKAAFGVSANFEFCLVTGFDEEVIALSTRGRRRSHRVQGFLKFECAQARVYGDQRFAQPGQHVQIDETRVASPEVVFETRFEQRA